MTIDAIMRRHLMRKKASGSIIELIKEKTELQGKLKESMEREAALEAKMVRIKKATNKIHPSSIEDIDFILSESRPALAVVEGRSFDDPGSPLGNQFRSHEWFEQFDGAELHEFMALSVPAVMVVLESETP